MNKRIYYFIVPLLTILFSIICTYDNAISFPKITSGLRITEASATHSLPFSSDLRKAGRKVNIHAIRVKARHDVVTANIPTHQEPVLHLVYYTKTYCSSYNSCELYAHLHGYNLRGPPLA